MILGPPFVTAQCEHVFINVATISLTKEGTVVGGGDDILSSGKSARNGFYVNS